MSLVFAAITPHPPLLIPTIGKNELKKINATKKALEKFKIAVPGWLNVRDFLEHFDEYAKGSGYRQKDGTAIVYGPYYCEEEQCNPNGTLIQKNYYLSFGEGNQIDIATTTREAGKLADATLGCLL